MKLIAHNQITVFGEAVTLGYAILALTMVIGILSPTTHWAFDYALTALFIIASSWFILGGYYRLFRLLQRKYNKIINRPI